MDRIAHPATGGQPTDPPEPAPSSSRPPKKGAPRPLPADDGPRFEGWAE